MAIPGIDLCLRHGHPWSEIGPDIEVFSSRRHLAAWAGLGPGNNESAGKRRSGRARRGNGTLREVLIECAHSRELRRFPRCFRTTEADAIQGQKAQIVQPCK